MTVYVVTDSTSCLPPALADEYGITVLDIHTSGQIPGESDDAAEGAVRPAEVAPQNTPASVPDTVDGDNAGDRTGVDSASQDGADEAHDGEDSGNSEDSEDPEGSKNPRDVEAEEPTTSGLGPLELTAAYARLLERGGDDGVVALHLSRELSSTWSSANQAAAVFNGLVEVVDTRTAGMALGQAAIAAARCAAEGGTLAECTAVASRVLADADVWLYVHRLDALARGGRLSTAQRLLSTALAIKPILHLNEGKIELAAKTRTQSKAMTRLVGLVEEAYRKAATPVPSEASETESDTAAGAATDIAGDAGTEEGFAASQGGVDQTVGVAADPQSGGNTDGAVDDSLADDVRAPETVTDEQMEGAPETTTSGRADDSAVEPERPRVFTFSGEHDFWSRKRREQPVMLADLPPTAMHLDIHQVGCLEVAEELRDSLRDALPECVMISVVDLSPALLVHTGPQALGVSFVKG